MLTFSLNARLSSYSKGQFPSSSQELQEPASDRQKEEEKDSSRPLEARKRNKEPENKRALHGRIFNIKRALVQCIEEGEFCTVQTHTHSLTHSQESPVAQSHSSQRIK